MSDSVSSAVGPSERRFSRELGALLRLGAPMVATQFFIMAMGFIDTAMAGRYDSVHLAGVALGGTVLWPVFMLTTGITMAITPIVAQLRGSGGVAESGARIRQGLWVSVAASMISVVIMLNAGALFAWTGVDPEAAAVAEGYLAAAAWGVPAAQFYIVLRYAAEGLGRTLPPMIITGLALPVNAVFNYVLIYGHFGAPELGGVGCGWATTVVWWMELGGILLLLKTDYFRATQLTRRFDWPDPKEILGIFKIGVPIGLTVFLEMAVFSVVGLSVATLGVIPLAANSIAGNVNWATYVFPMSIGSAASIRVGFYVGAQNFDAARFVGRVAFAVSVTYALVVSATLILARYQVAGLYSTDAAVIELAASLMVFIALYQLVDDSNATLSGVLRGYKDTRAPMLFSLIGYWFLALPLGAALCFGWLGTKAYGVSGYWMGMTVGLAIVACCMGWRLISTSRNVDRIRAYSTL